MENEIVQRIWFEIVNAQRWDLHWEQMDENKDGEYLLRDDVLAVIERHLTQRPPDPPSALECKECFGCGGFHSDNCSHISAGR